MTRPTTATTTAGKASAAKKLREAILLLARLTQNDPRCGKTKLNKLLFYADFGCYRKLGRSISGQRYIKREFGPVPASISRVIERMEATGECAWAQRDYFGRELHKLVPLREPDLAVLDPREVNLLYEVVQELWELNGTEVSDLSHRFIGWQAAEMGEEIPFETVFVAPQRALSEEELAWAHDAIHEHRERKAAG